MPLAGLLLLGLLAFAIAWNVGGPSVVRAEQDGATPAPTPTPSDLDLAAGLERLGEAEAAIDAYEAVVQGGTPQERLDARLALGRLYTTDGRVPAAVRHLDIYLFDAPEGTDVRAAQFLLAEALTARGDWSGALPLYEAYIEANGAASVYASMRRAEGLVRTGRASEGAQDGELLLTEDLPASVRLGFVLSMAQALDGRDQEAALAWYDRLLQQSDSPDDQALALFRMALIKGETGDAQGWTADLLAIVQRYPGTSIALQILDEYDALELLLDDYSVALVYYHNGRGESARRTFESLAEARPPTPNSARASYYLAVLDERAGDVEGAIAGYRRVLDIDASIELADDALWWLGRLLELEGRPDEARDAYQRLAAEYGGSKWAEDARFRPGLLDYDAGRFEEAAVAFAEVMEGADGEERQRAMFWQGKALEESGQGDDAQAAWEALRQEAGTEYYGLRAAVQTGEADGSLSDAGIRAETDADPDPDWDAMQASLVEVTGEDPVMAVVQTALSRHWLRGLALLELGLRREAGAEFGMLLAEVEGRPLDLYQLARYLHQLGMVDISSRAASRLLSALPDEDAAAAPSDLWKLAYPAPFGPALREAADAEDVPDVLLLAMIRQESFFDPLAGSSAGALGLTQVVAPTADAIASDLGVADFEFEDLERPSVSIRFGAHYIGEQLETFDGNIYFAMAAYNGGPGSVLRWLDASGEDASGSDVDRFVEEIDFTETRLYVRLVSENLSRYRELYQGLAEPSLPED